MAAPGAGMDSAVWLVASGADEGRSVVGPGASFPPVTDWQARLARTKARKAKRVKNFPERIRKTSLGRIVTRKRKLYSMPALISVRRDPFSTKG
jgi:hypothetical protein